MQHYLINASVLLAVLYLSYYLLLKAGSFLQANRLYLIVSIALSVSIPLIPAITISTSQPVLDILIEGVNVTNNIGAVAQQNTDLINPLMIIYLAGVTWFGLRFLTSLARLAYLFVRFPKTRVNGHTAVVLQGNYAPFTFFNILFISSHDEHSEESRGMIEHELAHIRQWHSMDALLAELLIIFFWFNPFSWLARIALKAEHEYSADRWVLNKGYNKQSYQQLLLHKAVGIKDLGLANNFNYSLLKNRLKMMSNTTHTTPVKYLIAAAILVFVAACSLTDTEKLAPTEEVTSTEIYDNADVMPEYPSGMMAARNHLTQNITYPEIAKENNISGKVWLQFVVAEDGSVQDANVIRTDLNENTQGEIVVVAYRTEDEKKSSANYADITALEEEALRVVKTLGKFTPGMKDGKPVKVRYTVPIVFQLQ